MFTMEPGADRYKLGFEQAVLENFQVPGDLRAETRETWIDSRAL